METDGEFWSEVGEVYDAFVDAVVRHYAGNDSVLSDEVEGDISEYIISMKQELDRKYGSTSPRVMRFGEINEGSGDRSMDRTYQMNLLINRLYTASRPYTVNLYHDNAWEHVYEHLEAIGKVKGVVDVECSSGQYYNYFAGTSPDINHPAYREYKLTIKSEWGDIEGRLICHSAGRTDDVFSSYDMTCTFWRKEDAGY